MKRSSGRVDETGMCHLLKYDLHTHTAFSDGRSPVRDMANAAESNGLRGIAITDHVFNDVQAEKLLGDYAGIDKTACPVEILFGCETAVRDVSGKPCASKKFLDRFELVLMDCNNILFSQLAGTPASPGRTARCSLRCDDQGMRQSGGEDSCTPVQLRAFSAESFPEAVR